MSESDLIDEIEMAAAQLAAITTPQSVAQRLRAMADELEGLSPAQN